MLKKSVEKLLTFLLNQIYEIINAARRDRVA